MAAVLLASNGVKWPPALPAAVAFAALWAVGCASDVLAVL